MSGGGVITRAAPTDAELALEVTRVLGWLEAGNVAMAGLTEEQRQRVVGPIIEAARRLQERGVGL